MKSIIRTAVLTLAIGGVAMIAAQPAHAGGHCATVSGTAAGIVKANVAKRAERRKKASINRWARKKGVKTVYVGRKHVSCGKGNVARVRCTASAYVCK